MHQGENQHEVFVGNATHGLGYGYPSVSCSPAQGCGIRAWATYSESGVTYDSIHYYYPGGPEGPLSLSDGGPIPIEGVTPNWSDAFAMAGGNVAGKILGNVLSRIAGVFISRGVGAAASETGFGGGTVFTHFTDTAGLQGITGLESVAAGETTTVGRLTFGMGQNSFLANAPGDIFITDLGANATAGQLNGIGVFGARQGFAIQFSREALFNHGITPMMSRPNIFTIPGGTTLNGTFNVIGR